MSIVVMHAVVSVDGFIADQNDEPGPLFDWYFNGDRPSSTCRGAAARPVPRRVDLPVLRPARSGAASARPSRDDTSST